MKFSDYMSNWLYGKNGYYSKYREIGKKGDFYTAVSSSQFFGGSIANLIIHLIKTNKLPENVSICEIGAHKGYLTADIIQFIWTLEPHLLKTLKFTIIERFEHLRNHQAQYLKESFGDEVQVDILESLDNYKVKESFFFANELFDAFPCELFYKGKIATVQNHKVEFKNPAPKKFKEIAENFNMDKGEIGIGYYDFALALTKSSKKFQFITFDYGDMFARSDFSIRIYKKHQVFPFFEEGLKLEELFGVSDLTYDVNFDFLKTEFAKAGIEFVEFKTQMKALVDFGIVSLLELLKKNVDEKTYQSEMNRAKVLIDPAFMGERFKMIWFQKKSD